MATKTFLRDSASDLTVGSATNKQLLLQQGSAKVASDATATAGGPNAGVQIRKGGSLLTWFSNPIQGPLTISGLITFNLWGFESATQANTGFDVLIERCDRAGVVLSTVIRSEHGTELGTTAAVRNWTGTPTSTSFNQGDRIKITVFGNDAGGNMGNGRTFTFDYGAGAAVDGDSYVQFTETIVEGAAGAETAPGTDAANVSAPLTAADSGTGTPAAFASQLLSAEELVPGTAAAISAANVPPGEPAPGSEAAAVAASADAADASPGSPLAAASSILSAAEATPGTDSSTSQANAPIAETSPGTDVATTSAEVSATEPAPGDAAALLQAILAAAESSPPPADISVTITVTVSETAPGAAAAIGEEQLPDGQAVNDGAPGSEAASLTVSIVVAETSPATVSAVVSSEIPAAEISPSNPSIMAAASLTVPLSGAGLDAAAAALKLFSTIIRTASLSAQSRTHRPQRLTTATPSRPRLISIAKPQGRIDEPDRP